MTTKLTTNQFKQTVLEADRPVLVDFYADWCAPCRSQATVVDDLAADVGEAALIAKVDVEAEPALAELFQIRALPTLLLFEGGKIAQRFTGFTDRNRLKAALAA